MDQFPPAAFDFLILSLKMQAESQLGLLKMPGVEETEVNLPLARHTIDLLVVLQEKTKGNLTLEEQRLLDNSITELRFRFIQAATPKPE
jgi:copper chaperone CopZ